MVLCTFLFCSIQERNESWDEMNLKIKFKNIFIGNKVKVTLKILTEILFIFKEY